MVINEKYFKEGNPNLAGGKSIRAGVLNLISALEATKETKRDSDDFAGGGRYFCS